MSYSNNYLPIPPRAWTRVENKCTYSDSIYDPNIYYRASLINKGNVLQYKKKIAHSLQRTNVILKLQKVYGQIEQKHGLHKAQRIQIQIQRV